MYEENLGTCGNVAVKRFSKVGQRPVNESGIVLTEWILTETCYSAAFLYKLVIEFEFANSSLA